jgi:hypothetical protein
LTSSSKSVFSHPEPKLTDAIHFRGPETWRGKIKSKRVRKWFDEFLDGQVSLAPADPGSGPLEVSVRIPRWELNGVAEYYGLSGTVLLRRIIAAHIGPSSQADDAIRRAPNSARATERIGRTASAQAKMLSSPEAQQQKSEPAPSIAPNGETRLTILTHVEGVRSLEEIDEAKRRGDGITFEELIRWRAVFERI